MTYFITAIQGLSGSIGELKWKASISEMQLLDTIIGSFLQVLLFSLIPFLTWLIFARKKEPSFFKWIGLTKPAIREWKLVLLVIAAGLLLWVLVTPLLNPLMDQSATTDYSRDGFTPLALIFRQTLQRMRLGHGKIKSTPITMNIAQPVAMTRTHFTRKSNNPTMNESSISIGMMRLIRMRST